MGNIWTLRDYVGLVLALAKVILWGYVLCAWILIIVKALACDKTQGKGWKK